MARTVSRTMSGMLRWALVEISPETTAIPVFTSVSQATRPPGSSRMIASRTPSEIWSATLSGWPSVTDSDVKRYSPSASGLEVGMRGSVEEFCPVAELIAVATATGCRDEVDDQRDALQLVGLAHPVLQVIGPIAGNQPPVVDLDRDPRRALPHLRGVVEPQPLVAAGRRRVLGDGVGEEAVQLRRRHPLGRLVGQLQGPRKQRADVAAMLGRDRDHGRAQPQFPLHPGAGIVDVGLADVPLVEYQEGGAAGFHRQLGRTQVLGGDPLDGVADDDRDVGAVHRPFGAQLRVVIDRPRRPAVSTRTTGRPSTSSRVSIASRVVPAMSETITRSEPRKALTSEDLPTLGRPITATRTVSSSSSCGSRSPRATTIASRRSPVPRPWVEETGSGSPRPRAWNSAAIA